MAARRWMALGMVLAFSAACSSPAATGPVEAADAPAQATDAAVDDSQVADGADLPDGAAVLPELPAVDTAADTPIAATPDALASDTGASDTGASDTAAADSLPDAPQPPPDAPTATVPGWLAGTWKDCGGTLVVAIDHTWTWTAADSGCTVTGAVLPAAGGLVDLLPDPNGKCKAPPKWAKPGVGLTLQGDLLGLVHPTLATGLKRFVQGAPIRQRWHVAPEGGGQATLDLCYTAAGVFYDGDFLDVDGKCQFVACGGTVDEVLQVDAQLHLWLDCHGGCPCAGIAVVTDQTATTMAGKFSVANCEWAYSGKFTAVLGVFPGD